MTYPFSCAARFFLFGVTLSILTVGIGTEALAQKSQKTQVVQPKQSTLKEVLTQYQGKATNLGTLVKVAGDYFVVEDEDGVQSFHPLATIHTVKVIKQEEGVTIVLEIRLVGKD